jgi:hypothetical protein
LFQNQGVKDHLKLVQTEIELHQNSYNPSANTVAHHRLDSKLSAAHINHLKDLYDLGSCKMVRN